MNKDRSLNSDTTMINDRTLNDDNESTLNDEKRCTVGSKATTDTVKLII
jgi:hypothetical protein